MIKNVFARISLSIITFCLVTVLMTENASAYLVPGNFHSGSGATSRSGIPGPLTLIPGGFSVNCSPSPACCWEITPGGVEIGGLVAPPDAETTDDVSILLID